MWQLIINGPGYFDTAYELPDGETLLGRADENDVILSGDQVSRRHARLYFDSGELFFEDLGSRNGTRVNGNFLVEEHRVEDGDVLTIGENTLTVRQPSDFEVAKTELLAEDDPLRASLSQQPFGEVLVSRSIEDNPFLEDIGLLDNFSIQDFEMLPFLDNFGSSTGEMASRSSKVGGEDSDGKGKAPGREELLLFAQVSEKLNSAASLDAFLDEVVALIVEVSHATTGVALMFDDKGKLSPAVVRNVSGQVPDDVPISRSIIGEVTKKKVALAVINAQSDAHFSNSESVIMYGLEQVICAPMLKGEELLGVIYLNRPAKQTKSMPLSRLVDIVNALAHMLASGIEKWTSRAQGQAEAQRRWRLESFHSPTAIERLQREGIFEIGKLDKKRVTAMFVDLGDASRICEALSAEKISSLLRDYGDLVRRIVFQFEGTLVHLMGTSALAVFGAPFARGDDADRAIRCAMACQQKGMALMGQKLPPSHGCGITIALDTSLALAGHLGTAENFEYAVLGRCVDAAMQLMAQARSGAILVTDAALKASQGQIPVRPAELFEQKLSVHKGSIYEVAQGDMQGEDELAVTPEPMVTKRQRLFVSNRDAAHGANVPEDGEGEKPLEAAPRAEQCASARPSRHGHIAVDSQARQAAPARESGTKKTPRPSLRPIPPLPRVPSRFSARSRAGQTEEPRPAIRPSLPPLPFSKKPGGSSASTVVASLPDLLQGAAGAATGAKMPPAPRPRPMSGAKSPLPPAPLAKRGKRSQE